MYSYVYIHIDPNNIARQHPRVFHWLFCKRGGVSGKQEGLGSEGERESGEGGGREGEEKHGEGAGGAVGEGVEGGFPPSEVEFSVYALMFAVFPQVYIDLHTCIHT